MSNDVRDLDALIAFVESRMRAPFVWGKSANDCVSFAGAAVMAQTGHDRLAALPNWTTARGAARALKRRGGLEAAVDSVLRPIAPAMAQRGDVALVETTTGPALMIVEGDGLIGPGAEGLIRQPRAEMRKAWAAV